MSDCVVANPVVADVFETSNPFGGVTVILPVRPEAVTLKLVAAEAVPYIVLTLAIFPVVEIDGPVVTVKFHVGKVEALDPLPYQLD